MTGDEKLVERVAFFPGQRLTAADLEATQAHNRRLRELHNRGLHDWGVASGLAVSGAKADREVSVAPGHALNRYGRELIVTTQRVKAIPAEAGSNGDGAEYVLCLGPADPEPAETRVGVCTPAGAVRISEAPELKWRAAGEVPADEVQLAAVRIRDCRLAGAPSPEDRRDALGGPRPRIASGETPTYGTRWRFWPDEDDASTAVGVATEVDTANGGFRLTPHYQARLAGNRVVERDGQQFVVEGHAEVDAAEAAGFTLRVTMPRDLRAGDLEVNPSWAFTDGLTDVLKELGAWRVVWLGVEP